MSYIDLNKYSTGGPETPIQQQPRMINNIVFSSDIYIISSKETGLKTKSLNLNDLRVINNYYPTVAQIIYNNYLKSIL